MAQLFVACLQAAVQITSMGLMISAEVLDGKVRDFYKQYQKQCDIIKQISDLVKKLELKNQTLMQLKQADVYVSQNWAILEDQLQKKVKQTEQLSKSFADVKKKSVNTSTWWQDTIQYSLFTLGAFSVGMSIYNVFKQYKNFRISRGNLALANEQGNLRVNSNENILKRYWKNNTGKTMAMHGLRLILFIAGVYSLVMGAINVNQLRGVLQDTEQYFGKTGQFQTEIIKFMDLLDSMSTDIKDLTFAAKASICELNKYYLVRSIAYDDDKNQSNDILGDLNPISYGFTDAKLNKVLQFERDVKACKNIPGEGNEDYADHYSKRLEAYKVQYKLIINQEKLNEIFADLTQRLSKLVSKESLRSDIVNKTVQRFTKTQSYIMEMIKNKRGQTFQTKNVEEKVQIDKKIWKRASIIYCSIIRNTYIDPDDESQYLAKNPLSDLEKERVAGFILMCTNAFYGDDITGTSINKIKYSDVDTNQTYQQLLKMTSGQFQKQSLSQLVPLWWDNKEKEAKDQWGLLRKAKIWVQKYKPNDLTFASILKLTIPPQQQIKDNKGLPDSSRRYLMINMKKAYEKDEKGQDTPTLKVDGRQCIVFKPENITFRYSTNTVLSQEIVEIIQEEKKDQ